VLCVGGEAVIVCYLCLEEISVQAWDKDNHRLACARRNTAQLSIFSTHSSVRCGGCQGKLRVWPDQGPAFYCDSVSPPCKNTGQQLPSYGGNRYNCFLCDYDLCKECVKAKESEATSKANNGKEEEQDDDHIDEETISQLSEIKFKIDSIKDNDDDDIPLIDSQGDTEEIPVIVDDLSKRPSIDIKHYGGDRDGLDSPDIFHLRAPLVSCENILTPSMSQENILST